MICTRSENVTVVHSNHAICKQCFNGYAMCISDKVPITYTHEGPILSGFQCPARGCRFMMHNSITKGLLQKELYGIILEKNGGDYNPEVVPHIHKAKCMTCSDEFAISYMISLQCDGFVCKACLIKY